MTRLSAGQLRERITFQEKNLVDNGRGGRKRPDGQPEWKDIASHPKVRAEIIALRGEEALSHLVARSRQLWRVTIRYRADINTELSILWNDLRLNIRSAAPNEARDGLVMTCESGVPG